MGLQPLFTNYPWTHAFTEVIDVRSPLEFAVDHLPGAINLPVLSDAERAEVGTLYKQVSPFEARKLGAALVSQNLAIHLQQHFQAKPKGYFPVVYCWRGGQRSQSMATVLTQIGWRTGVLIGGYKAYRAYVRDRLLQVPKHLKFQVLCGLTGTAKTDILQKLEQNGASVLDLEGLACHRGSLLGQMVKTHQPSQKAFESLLLRSLSRFKRDQPIWVEAESNKIGQVFIPGVLWTCLRASPCIEVQATLDSRVQYLRQTYQHFVQDLPHLKTYLHLLKDRYGKKQLQQWDDWIDQTDIDSLVRSLLEVHYDPAYCRSMKSQYLTPSQRHFLPDLSPMALAHFAQSLLAS